MANGIIKRYSEDRGFGLLFRLGTKADTPEVFFHVTHIIGSRAMEVGAEVRFQLIRSERHGEQAVNVELLELGGRRTLKEAEIERKRDDGDRYRHGERHSKYSH